MKNKIIIDGFWNTGKSSVIAALKQADTTIISEPNHLTANLAGDDIDQWYVDRHGKNHETLYKLSEDSGVLMERSIISSMALLYATGKSLESTEKIFNRFKDWYANNDSLAVVLYVEDDKLGQVIGDIKDDKVKKLLDDKEFVRRYNYFFRVILPFKYDIPPLFINIFDEKSGARKDGEIIAANINKAIEEDRVAQANVVCFKIMEGKPKFLVMQRNEKKGGFWQTITGGIHIRDLLDVNVLREVGEEIGIEPKLSNLVSTMYTFHYIGGEGYELNEYVYGYKLEETDQVTLSSEHVASEFLDMEEAVERVKYEGNKNAIREVSRSILL